MATVSISSLVVPNWQYGGTTAKLRIFLGTAFVSSAGVPLQSGAPGSGAFYKDITCTISGTDITVPLLTIDSTADGLDIQSARYSAFFYNSAGQRLKSYEGFSNFAVGPNPASTTWAEIRTFNFDLQPNRDFTAYTKQQSDARYATAGTSGVVDPGSGGFMARTALNVSAARTLTGTTNQIAITNGTGAAGDPVFSLTGPYSPATYTSNGVLYGAATGSLLATAQGAANSVLTANAGAPAFSALPQVDRAKALPATVTYDQVSNTLGYGFGVGSTNAASLTALNVGAGQIYAPFMVTMNNTGQGKLLGYYCYLEASGATQDAGQEPIRLFYGRAVNSSTANAKTSAVRAGVTATGANGSLLIGIDSDVTPAAGTNNASAVFGVTIEGTTDDVASGLLMYQGSSNPRYLQGVGSIAPIKFGAVAFRAWMGTGSAASARGFQQLNNSGTELFYTDLTGNIVTTGIITAGSGAVAITNSTGNVLQSAVANLGLVMITSTNVTSPQATVDFTALDDTYDAYILVVSSAKPATDDVEAWLRIGTGGGPTYQTSGYSWQMKLTVDTNEIAPIGVTSDAQIEMTFAAGGTVAVGNASGENWSGTIRFDNPEASNYMNVRVETHYNRAADGLGYSGYGGGQYNTVGAVTGIRFMFSSGNVSTGRFTLYGYRKS